MNRKIRNKDLMTIYEKKSKSTIEPRKAIPAKYANEQPELDSISQLLLERILHFFDPRLRIANPNSDYHL